MHLRLWHRLFLAFAVLSVAIIAGFVVWQQHSFRQGFSTYLNEVTLQRLQSTAERLGEAYAERGGSWDFLRGDAHAFDAYVDSFHLRHKAPIDELSPGPGVTQGELGMPPEPPSSNELRPPPGGPPPRGGASSRVLLVDAAGVVVVGDARIADAQDLLREVIRSGDTEVGSLLMRKIPPRAFGGSDLAFALAQRRAAIVAGSVALLVALGFAFALARWLLAPVRALASGMHALTAGDYARRIAAGGSAELGALARDFNRLAQTLEAHRDARRRWGADIAHELRTPLSVLRGEIAALQDGVRAPTAAAFDSLAVEGERLSGLIEDLYQLALADAGALEYRFELLDLAEVVRDAVQLHQRACADAGLALELSVPPDTLAVRGDARRLGQLLDNLIVNARRYTDAPGRIRIALARAQESAHLVVEDTPPGVPAESLPLLFDRLYRIDSSRARHSGGAGLGLAICRAIVEAHGGTIRSAASPLGGLSIFVDLPQATETLA
ncbi:MAG: HAMP domain-containing protein [Proteobacteria bacterium]|uniref:ATP-binding protein n=1 Tax=Rudaea sp. TaxID=2136325 RepID=UPI00378464C4|nr:HAMP domain-containing protein [Pseudomonadota bacterium]